MKLVLRVLGTWFLGLALILLIMDGTRSLSANEIVTTPLIQLWSEVHATSWAQVQGWIALYLDPLSLSSIVYGLLGWPAWAPVAVLGLVFIILGRKRSRARYIDSM